MKWKLLTHISIAIVVFAFVGNQSAEANVFAAQIKVTNPDDSPFDSTFTDGTGAKISFFLNDSASSVMIDIVNLLGGNTVHTIVGGAMSRGLQSVEWDGTGVSSDTEYAIRITTEQDNYSTTDWTMFYDSGDIDIFTRGVAVVTDQDDPNLGLIFTSNDGGPLGTGINIYNPDGSQSDPFLVAADVINGGTITYGTDAPIYAALDWQGRVWVTLKDLGTVMRINRDFTSQAVIEGLTFPSGLYLTGEGPNFTIYVSADNQVLRGNVGTADTFDPNNLETVAEFSTFFPRQIMLDDDGFMYVTLRESALDLGSNGKGIRKYDISSNLPKTDDQAEWFLSEDKTFIANDLLLDSGADPNTSTDDILYFCTRAGSAQDQDGIWRIDDINSFFPDTVRIADEQDFYGPGSDDNINARATMDFDAAGNIVLMENSNEHIFFVAPPGDGPTNSFTTMTAEPIIIVGIDDGENVLPITTRLKGNYPNPFNPATTIAFDLGQSDFVTLTVYDMLGRTVRNLVNKQLAPGSYQVLFDAENLATGVYLYELRAGSVRETRKMLLTR